MQRVAAGASLGSRDNDVLSDIPLGLDHPLPLGDGLKRQETDRVLLPLDGREHRLGVRRLL